MLMEYWWILIIGILLLMIFYPINRRYIKKSKKKVRFNLKPLITNIPTITSYYIGMN